MEDKLRQTEAFLKVVFIQWAAMGTKTKVSKGTAPSVARFGADKPGKVVFALCSSVHWLFHLLNLLLKLNQNSNKYGDGNVVLLTIPFSGVSDMIGGF